MEKLSVLGILGGAALLAATPFSVQWPQQNVGSTAAASLITLSQAEAQTSGCSGVMSGAEAVRTDEQRRTGQ